MQTLRTFDERGKSAGLGYKAPLRCPHLRIGLSEEEVKEVIESTKKLWPGCQIVPYNALPGQPPRVGISNLPISAELMDSHVTEADLNMALGLEEDDMIENLREDVLAPEKQAKEDEEEQHAEEQARQEQQPQEEEDMDAFRTPAPLPIDALSQRGPADTMPLSPRPNLPWDPETYCAPCKAWWHG
eukprot:jgi/Tetstr1/460156/TSEL_005472.t1